jgi:hypothetical protein
VFLLRGIFHKMEGARRLPNLEKFLKYAIALMQLFYGAIQIL